MWIHDLWACSQLHVSLDHLKGLEESIRWDTLGKTHITQWLTRAFPKLLAGGHSFYYPFWRKNVFWEYVWYLQPSVSDCSLENKPVAHVLMLQLQDLIVLEFDILWVNHANNWLRKHNLPREGAGQRKLAKYWLEPKWRVEHKQVLGRLTGGNLRPSMLAFRCCPAPQYAQSRGSLMQAFPTSDRCCVGVLVWASMTRQQEMPRNCILTVFTVWHTPCKQIGFVSCCAPWPVLNPN